MTRDKSEQPSAGDVGLHGSPFDGLEVPVASERLPPGIRARWVVPFYMNCLSDVDKTAAALHPIYCEITPSLVVTLLSPLNWRPRITAAYFTAFRRFVAVEQIIGRLLLRSDVCFAGSGYCLALARLNTPTAVNYLREYLGYYLTRPDLCFDQGPAMAAMIYLDRTNRTNYASELMPRWNDFVPAEPSGSLEENCRFFTKQMQAIEGICSRMPQCSDDQSRADLP